LAFITKEVSKMAENKDKTNNDNEKEHIEEIIRENKRDEFSKFIPKMERPEPWPEPPKEEDKPTKD
jgi:hypothetical protein